MLMICMYVLTLYAMFILRQFVSDQIERRYFLLSQIICHESSRMPTKTALDGGQHRCQTDVRCVKDFAVLTLFGVSMQNGILGDPKEGIFVEEPQFTKRCVGLECLQKGSTQRLAGHDQTVVRIVEEGCQGRIDL